MFTESQPYVEPLTDGLILKSVSTDGEIERLAAFNVMIHHEDMLAGMTRSLIRHHPATRPEHWLIVEDTASGAIVSSLCQIPWTLRYDGVDLNAGEMGIVGTHPDYRGRGLIRQLDRRFKALLHERGCDLSQIQGIPYYYRRLGYEYAMPLEGGAEIMPHQIPDDLPPHAAAITFRLATVDDIPLLVQFYDDAMRDLDIHTVRDAATWRYLFDHADDVASGAQTWIALDTQQQPTGYVRIAQRGFGTGLIIEEASRLSHAGALAVLGLAKREAQQRDKPYIRLLLSDANPLHPTAKAWGAHDGGRYAWQIMVPDPARFLRTITPALERRIAASPFAGLTQTVTLNLYHDMIDLRFEEGTLVEVTSGPPREANAENHIPPHLLPPWMLGYKSRAELHAMYPDFNAWGQTAYLLDVLFPKMESFLYNPY